MSDPDKGADIVSLGMVSGLVVKEGNVGFSIEVDPAGIAARALRAAEAAVDNYRVFYRQPPSPPRNGKRRFGGGQVAIRGSSPTSRRCNHWRWS